MSDGGGKGRANFVREKENHPSKSEKTNEFAQAIARVGTAQVCESLGFQGFRQPALETLADIGIRYIREVGKAARSCANSANRTQCNVFDVIQGLEDLGSIQGFLGASDVSHSLSLSGVVRDMIRYLCKAEQIPFAYSIPSFPVVKKRKLDPSFAEAKENPPDEHIPTWLSKFPDPEARVGLTPGNEKMKGMVNKIDQLNGHHRNQILCNGSKAEGAIEEIDTSNPFLAPPLPFEEQEVSLPIFPDKLLGEVGEHNRSCEVIENHPLNPESSFNGTERNGHSESGDRRKVIANGRPSVHFKFGNGKKPFSIGKISMWFSDDLNGIDEKGMKAEKFLLENMESLPEASPL